MLNPILTVDDVIATAATTFGVTLDDLIGPSCVRPLSHYRHAAMAVTRDLTAASYPEIARAFGRVDHTTAINAVRRAVANSDVAAFAQRLTSALHELYDDERFFPWVVSLRCGCGWQRALALPVAADAAVFVDARSSLLNLRARHTCQPKEAVA